MKWNKKLLLHITGFWCWWKKRVPKNLPSPASDVGVPPILLGHRVAIHLTQVNWFCGVIASQQFPKPLQAEMTTAHKTENVFDSAYSDMSLILNILPAFFYHSSFSDQINLINKVYIFQTSYHTYCNKFKKTFSYSLKYHLNHTYLIMVSSSAIRNQETFSNFFSFSHLLSMAMVFPQCPEKVEEIPFTSHLQIHNCTSNACIDVHKELYPTNTWIIILRYMENITQLFENLTSLCIRNAQVDGGDWGVLLLTEVLNVLCVFSPGLFHNGHWNMYSTKSLIIQNGREIWARTIKINTYETLKDVAWWDWSYEGFFVIYIQLC